MASTITFNEVRDILDLLNQLENADLISIDQIQTIGDEVLPVLKRLLGSNYELLQSLLDNVSASTTSTTIKLNLIQ